MHWMGLVSISPALRHWQTEMSVLSRPKGFVLIIEKEGMKVMDNARIKSERNCEGRAVMALMM